MNSGPDYASSRFKVNFLAVVRGQIYGYLLFPGESFPKHVPEMLQHTGIVLLLVNDDRTHFICNSFGLSNKTRE